MPAIGYVTRQPNGSFKGAAQGAFDPLGGRDHPQPNGMMARRRLTPAGAARRAMADGSWRIAEDHRARAAAHQRSVARDRPVTVTLLSVSLLERLARLHADTWIVIVSSMPVINRRGTRALAGTSAKRRRGVDNGSSSRGLVLMA